MHSDMDALPCRHVLSPLESSTISDTRNFQPFRSYSIGPLYKVVLVARNLCTAHMERPIVT
jgi:hypothetical protein